MAFSPPRSPDYNFAYLRKDPWYRRYRVLLNAPYILTVPVSIYLAMNDVYFESSADSPVWAIAAIYMMIGVLTANLIKSIVLLIKYGDRAYGPKRRRN